MGLKSPLIIDALNRLNAKKEDEEDGLSLAERYYIYRRPNSQEHHIFRGTWNPIFKQCSLDDERLSICKKMALKTAEERKADMVFNCLDEQEARDHCAALARDVCGICVSNLYATQETLLEI